MTFYLIDYENTQVHGLKGLAELSKSDRVYIFYSDNAKSISIDSMNDMLRTKCRVFFEHIETGRDNALDFQLTSWLGYLIHKHPFSRFRIITKDKGFECLKGFWKAKGKDIEIFHNIAGELNEDPPVLPNKQAKRRLGRCNNQNEKLRLPSPKKNPSLSEKSAMDTSPQLNDSSIKSGKVSTEVITHVENIPEQKQKPNEKQGNRSRKQKKDNTTDRNVQNRPDSSVYDEIRARLGNSTETELVIDIVRKHTTKQEVHNALQRTFNSDENNNRAKEIYKKIKAILPHK
ncbi:MAG: PIN domain-containing protein [Clostridia bacterium]|nr:PIN domain-containing protein [Clostridia bacterium]